MAGKRSTRVGDIDYTGGSSFGGSGTYRGSTYQEEKLLEKQLEVEKAKKVGSYTVEEVLKLHETVIQQDTLLERLTKAGVEYARVIDFDDGHPVVNAGRGGVKAEKPEFAVAVGDWVFVSEDTKQIVEIRQRTMLGTVVTISRVLPDGRRAEVGGIMGSSLLRIPEGVECKPGEEWLCAADVNALIHKIDRPLRKEQDDYSPVQWDEIGGLARVKQELRESIALIRGDANKHSQYYKVTQPKGVMLYGPPGNGKTMLCRAVATELAGDTTQFKYVKGPEILSKFVGVSEEKVRHLFLWARQSHERTGKTAVIAIDEADAIMNSRGSGRSSDVERTIVPAFLTEMDGLERSHAFVMLLTNRPDTLDPAVVREGRIDQHVLVDKPDAEAIRHILTIHLKDLPAREDRVTLANLATEILSQHREVSGAMCAAVMERAKRIAMRRDMASGKNSGLRQEDMIEAARAAVSRT